MRYGSAFGVVMACLSGPSLGQAVPDHVTAACETVLNPPSTAAGMTAQLDLRRGLATQPAEVTATVVDRLIGELAASREPVRIGRAGTALLGRASDTPIQVLVGRLNVGEPEAIEAAVCQAITVLAEAKRPSADVAKLALVRLEAAIKRPDVSPRVARAAALAIGSLGPAGLDVLVRIQQEPDVPGAVQDVYFAALAQTGDTRALRVFRGVAGDPGAGEGRRIAAAWGIGNMLRAVREKDGLVDDVETAACLLVLRNAIGRTGSDQLFAACLKSLGAIPGAFTDTGVRMHLAAALVSPSRYRREAALEALYEQPGRIDPSLLATVQELSTKDTDETVRISARSVLERDGLSAE